MQFYMVSVIFSALKHSWAQTCGLIFISIGRGDITLVFGFNVQKYFDYLDTFLLINFEDKSKSLTKLTINFRIISDKELDSLMDIRVIKNTYISWEK